MDMKVDSRLIRAEREKRGWSQEHLASVAGLSLRTIQRIENTGSASFESTTALASVLAIEVADLRVSELQPAHALRVSLEVPMRLALAAISGFLCALHFHWRSFNTSWSLGFEWFDYGIAGALFGVAVLCPNLRYGPGLVLRAFGLIGASALSYFCAVSVTMFGGLTLPAFLLASFVSLAVVLVAARFLVPLRVTATFWFVGLVASLVGGAAMYLGFEVFGDTTWSRGVGYVVWNMAACLAIYHDHQSSNVESGLLADFIRTRGRFSIVTGWMKLGIVIPSKLINARAEASGDCGGAA
jgi:transcriptional regulator with XRE-family HTH domain